MAVKRFGNSVRFSPSQPGTHVEVTMTAAIKAITTAPVPIGLRIALSEQDSSIIIRLDGEWDLAAQELARQATRHALSRQPARVVLDLSGLTFIDSSGIHIVIELVKGAARLEIELAIIPGTAAVQRVFEVCGLTSRLPFTGDDLDTPRSQTPL